MMLIGLAYVAVGLLSFSRTWVLGLATCIGGAAALFAPPLATLIILAITLGGGSLLWAAVAGRVESEKRPWSWRLRSGNPRASRSLSQKAINSWWTASVCDTLKSSPDGSIVPLPPADCHESGTTRRTTRSASAVMDAGSGPVRSETVYFSGRRGFSVCLGLVIVLPGVSGHSGGRVYPGRQVFENYQPGNGEGCIKPWTSRKHGIHICSI